MESLKIYRKRLIPDECIWLKDDIVLLCNEEFIVTRWKTLKPRKDFSHGFSVYCLKEGIKVSKFYKPDETLRYWYCDVVDYDINVTPARQRIFWWMLWFIPTVLPAFLT